jgi:hypothetical protein
MMRRGESASHTLSFPCEFESCSFQKDELDYLCYKKERLHVLKGIDS